MSARFSINGSMVTLQNKDDSNVLDVLPVGTYIAAFHPDIGFYLNRTDNFALPKKVYGKVNDRADRFLKTFESRSETTGILLAGEKGSGKSLTMKQTSVEGLNRGIPTIIINDSFAGTGFNKFIASIDQPIIIIFDEFEKVYEPKDQEKLLTLLDGTFQSKKLVIFTVNKQHKVNEHMINRPGRIFYYITYDGLDRDFIEAYCRDNLKDITKLDQILFLTSIGDKFNFDMLQALVEELNRYGENVHEALTMLNAKPQFSSAVRYSVSITEIATSRVIDKKYQYSNVVNNPLLEEMITVDFENISTGEVGEQEALKKKTENEDVYVCVNCQLHGEHSVISKDLSTIKLVSDDGVWSVLLTKEEPKTYNPLAYL